MISIVGTSHAPQTFSRVVNLKHLETSSVEVAELVIVAEDTPTKDGRRDLDLIRNLVLETRSRMKPGATLVLTSQVPPGFTRSLGFNLYHQSETLRIKDAMDRALNPEQHIVGCKDVKEPIPFFYLKFLLAFECPIHKVSWEEAEFSKISINMTLASQVENANRLSQAAAKVGANWDVIKNILQHDKRIGPYSYLETGRWQDSQHLLRDYVTLKEIENER